MKICGLVPPAVLAFIVSMLFGPYGSEKAYAGDAAVEAMIQVFGDTCVTGEYTQAAITKALGLSAALKAMGTDPDCSGLSNASAQADAINTTLSILEKKKSDTDGYIGQESALLSSIAASTDPTLTAGLQGLFAKVETSKKNSDLEDKAIAAQAVVVQTRNLVKNAIDNKNCLFKKPNVFAELASLVSSVGSVVATVNPAIGLGTAVGGNLLRDLIDLALNARYVKGANRIRNTTLKPEAVACVMESLSKDYCNAKDAMNAIDWKARHKSIKDYPMTSPIFATRLVDREIPAFVNWLDALQASVLAQNPYTAARVSDFLSKEAAFRGSIATANGFLNPKRETLKPGADLHVVWPVLKSAIIGLVRTLSGDGMSSRPQNPLFQTYNLNEAEFYLVGFDKVPVKKDGNTMNFEYGDYDPTDTDATMPPNGLLVDVDKILERFGRWYALAEVNVKIERAQITQPDVQRALELAFKKESDENKISPYEAMGTIISFFELQLVGANAANVAEFKYYLPNTLERLRKIKELLDRYQKPNQTFGEDSLATILSEIYKYADLENGKVVMEARLIDHADNALVRYLTDPNLPQADSSILAETLSSRRMTEVLLKTNSGKNLADVRVDIDNSMGINLSTFEQFVNFFQKDIRKVLEKLNEDEQNYGLVMGATYKNKRAKICLLLTEAVSWPEKIPYYLCEGTSLNLLPGGPVSKQLTPAVMTNPDPEKRSCLLHYLKRDTLIYQTRGQFN